MKHFKKLALLSLLAWFSACEAPQGDAGPKGTTGPAGTTGANGANGPLGIKGDAGLVGPVGDTGPKGVTGTSGSLTSFSTAWAPMTWTVESEVVNLNSKNFIFSSEIKDERITENTINNGLNALYFKSNIKFNESKLIYRVEEYYRQVSTSGLYTKYSLANGKVLLKISARFTTDQANALRDSLNKDNIQVKFQSIN